MHVIDWTGIALDDLRAIDTWLTREASPATAARILSTIRQRAIFLETFPMIGRPNGIEHRILIVTGTRYLIWYRIVDQTIQVLRVLHERQDRTGP